MNQIEATENFIHTNIPAYSIYCVTLLNVERGTESTELFDKFRRWSLALYSEKKIIICGIKLPQSTM